MDGRRINSKTRKYNPLFILFLCLIAAVIVLLIVSVVMGAKLGKANKNLKAAEARVLELEKSVAQLESDLELARSRAASSSSETASEPANEPAPKPTPEPTPAQQPSKQETQQTQKQEDTQQTNNSSSWLNLSGHSEVKYKPASLLDGYQTYYTADGVNLRSGPDTSYSRVTTVNRGTKVQVAAREGGWSFVSVDGKFGWINSDYLSKTLPEPSAASSAEATSGSLKKN